MTTNKSSGTEKAFKPAKICKCGCFDIDHSISQVYGIYNCLNCRTSCSSSDFKKLPKDRFEEWNAKFNQLKRKGELV